MNVRQYLDRIKVSQIREPSYSFLQELLLSHLITIPFENLDIRQGVEIVLDERHIYEKIVVHRRGGFCYELNGLFCWLLRELDFPVSMVSGRVYIPTDDRFTPEFDHMVLLVQLDYTYMVDVGFGDCFRNPIAMPKGTNEDISGKYRIQSQNSTQDIYFLQRQENDKWRTLYSFTPYPRQLTDFVEMCVFNQTSSESHFTQKTVCSIAKDYGRVTLSDNSLTITKGGKMERGTIPSQEIFRQMLFEYFGIQLMEIQTLTQSC